MTGSGGRFLPLAAMRFRAEPNAAAARLCPGLSFDDTRDYVMWVLGAPAAAFGQAAADLPGLDGGTLRDRAREVITDWHEDLAALIARCDPATVRGTTLRTAVPVPPWPTGPVTLMGDAIHCMIPAGIGAAVALQDAGQLARRLAAARGGDTTVADAVHHYEADMLEYGFAAVTAAQQAGQQFA